MLFCVCVCVCVCACVCEIPALGSVLKSVCVSVCRVKYVDVRQYSVGCVFFGSKMGTDFKGTPTSVGFGIPKVAVRFRCILTEVPGHRVLGCTTHSLRDHCLCKSSSARRMWLVI